MITVLDSAPYVAGALGIGGAGVLASRRRELILRWTTWAVTAPLVGGAMLLGAPGATALAAGVGIVCTVSMDGWSGSRRSTGPCWPRRSR
jgi:phosphatidate cytidylyltransferase